MPSRRSFLLGGLQAGFAAASGESLWSAPWPVDDGLRVIDVRVVRTRPRNPYPKYEPAPGSYWATREAARPIEVHREYTGKRGPGSKWMPDRLLGAATVEVSNEQRTQGLWPRRLRGGTFR